MKRLHAIVEGRVQDVGFRQFVRERAQRLGLTGWVRNRAGGDVELIAEGEDIALNHLVLLLEKGPPLSRVEEVHVAYSMPTGDFPDFRVIS